MLVFKSNLNIHISLAHILRVSLTLRVSAVKSKSQTQPVRGEGGRGNTTGYPVTVLREEVALLRRGTANARGDEQKSG